MTFFEENLYFEIPQAIEKGIFDNDLPGAKPEPEIQGIKVRLGNAPIVYNLKRLMELSNQALPPEIEILFEQRDIYLVTHAVGIARVSGRAKVKEVQYNAEVVDLPGAQTIDLLPNSKFKTVLGANASLQGAVRAAGSFSAAIPEELSKALTGHNINLGGELDLELSANTQFVGKINFSIKLPLVQATGVSSNKCTWVLNPDANPLLGDQLLVQTIAVPKGTIQLTYSVKGLIKVDKGLLHKTESKETSTQTIQLNLK